MNKGKLSIIIPIYNTSKYLRKCLDSVLSQTYKDLEIILVNDCSTDNSQSIIDEYCKKDSRFKCVNNPKNLGLFKTRISGAKEATGDYITFLDSDDYITIDFYRTMIYNITKNNSDMVLGNTILEYDDGKKIIFSISDMEFEKLENDDLLDSYFRQHGLNFSWHSIWNKVYKMDLWKKAVKHYEKLEKHLIMSEDFAFSTVLFYYAKSMTRIENDGLYYCKHESSASTSVVGLTLKKMLKNLDDLITSFNFVEEFMKEVNIYEKYKNDFISWKKLYRGQQENIVNNLKFNDDEMLEIKKKIDFFSSESEIDDRDSYFSSIQTDWNNKYEEIKKMICNPEIRYISFDIFDTLIVRPFYTPTDLFVLLDNDFKKLSQDSTGVDFSKMRVNAEKQARNYLVNKKVKEEEVTLDDIYDVLVNDYNISKMVANKMKKLEVDAEVRFCTKRKAAFELYEMALAIGKKVICTSDMYLPKNIIQKILTKNGYNEIEEIYLSSEVMLTKSTGNLFDYVKEKLNIDGSQIIHIGDNYESDVLNAQCHEINSIHFRKATDIFFDQNITNNLGQLFIRDLPDWQDNVVSMQFLGIRTMVAVVANKFFDNPYKSFHTETDFNANPYLMGYYALGMHLYGVVKWLIDATNNNYDSIVFMARDGYLPMEAYKLMRKIYKDIPEEKYLYISRKAYIPIVVKDECNLYKLSEVIGWYNKTPNQVLKYTRNVFEINDKQLNKICKKENINLDEKFENESELYKFLSILASYFFDKKKHAKKLEILKKYFDEYFMGKSCVFDIGYSARPELFLADLCQKGIDTYFININHEEAIKHSINGSFNLNTFYDYKPKFTGLLREILFSKCAPSCIEYKIEDNKVTEIFEKYSQNYQEKFLINTIQNASLDFISDMISIFGDDLDRLYYQNYYISLPYEMLLHSTKLIDRMVMDAIIFEDDIGMAKRVSVTDEWNKEIILHNQHSLNNLFSINDNASKVDLSNRSILIKLIYYVFIDRVPLKRKIKNKFKNNKIIYFVLKKNYNLMRRAKHFCYKLTTKKSDS